MIVRVDPVSAIHSGDSVSARHSRNSGKSKSIERVGRVKTIREPFKNGGYSEVGALRIPNNHHWTMKYIKLMGLESKLTAYNADTGERLWYLQNKRVITPKGEWRLDGLTAREKADPLAMAPVYLRDALKIVGNPLRPEFPTREALALDASPVHEYFRHVGAQRCLADAVLRRRRRARRVQRDGDDGVRGDPERRRVEGDLRPRWRQRSTPEGDRGDLGSRTRYGRQVLKLAHTHDGVTVTVRDASGQHEIAGDRCICALPFPLLKQIVVTPAFSRQKMDAIQRYQLYPAARAIFQTKTRFWRRDTLGPLGGLKMVGTDTPAGRVWNTSHLQPDPTLGMLQSYMVGDHATAFAGVPAANRISAWTDLVSQFLPGLREETVASYAKVWHEDPWQKGRSRSFSPTSSAGSCPPQSVRKAACISRASTRHSGRDGRTARSNRASAV